MLWGYALQKENRVHSPILLNAARRWLQARIQRNVQNYIPERTLKSRIAKYHRKAGFTLIELLVVIALIAFLAALLPQPWAAPGMQTLTPGNTSIAVVPSWGTDATFYQAELSLA